MNCNESRYLLFDYVDDKLSSDTRKNLDEHLASCPDCVQRLEQLQRRQRDQENPDGMFFYLLKPSGGYKRIFIAGAVVTFVLFGALTYLHFKGIIF